MKSLSRVVVLICCYITGRATFLFMEQGTNEALVAEIGMLAAIIGGFLVGRLSKEK